MQAFFAELWSYLKLGGYVMPPLVACTVLLWFAIGMRFSLLKRGSQRSVRALIARYGKGKQKAPQGIVDAAVKRGLEIKSEPSPVDLRDRLDDEFADVTQNLKRFGVVITAIVAVAPLLGLLGTVSGMIETFNSLGDMSLFSQSGGIAGGISQALFTTQMGLAVAIPGLLVKNFLDRRQRTIEMELAQTKDILCADNAQVSGAV